MLECLTELELKYQYERNGKVLTFWCILVKSDSKKLLSIDKDLSTSRLLEDILGCKWTVVVLRNIADGTTRPGALTRKIRGLTAKVLNERLRKLLRYEIISRKVFSEIPPKVEYHLTPLGNKISRVIAELEKIESELVDKV